jgi:hypothetical protein
MGMTVPDKKEIEAYILDLEAILTTLRGVDLNPDGYPHALRQRMVREIASKLVLECELLNAVLECELLNAEERRERGQ